MSYLPKALKYIGGTVFTLLGIFASVLWLAPGLFGVSIPWGQIFGAELDSNEAFQRLQTTPQYRFDIAAGNLPNARMLRITPNGHLLISQPRLGQISLLENNAQSKLASKQPYILIKGLKRPHGMDFFKDWLYIAESNAVGRIRYDAANRKTVGAYERIITNLADNGNHWTKTLRLGPDGWFYLSSGSTCNVCIEQDPQRATIMRFKPDGSELQLFAEGLRNSVGFDWSPRDGALYATDNGRDLLGDDYPPCELNRIEKNAFYGWPFVNGNNEPDPDYGKSPLISKTTFIPPVHHFKAHNAPLGITFLRHSETPPAYYQSALVALHGSWNRSEKDGYKVVSLHWSVDGTITEQDFFWGFEQKGYVIGRPVDVIQDQQGNIFVSDDYAGAVYRLSANTTEK